MITNKTKSLTTLYQLKFQALITDRKILHSYTIQDFFVQISLKLNQGGALEADLEALPN